MDWILLITYIVIGVPFTVVTAKYEIEEQDGHLESDFTIGIIAFLGGLFWPIILFISIFAFIGSNFKKAFK